MGRSSGSWKTEVRQLVTGGELGEHITNNATFSTGSKELLDDVDRVASLDDRDLIDARQGGCSVEDLLSLRSSVVGE